ncbi:MAG: 50S ribosomal protein L13 [Clostridia bacterium]
MNTYMAKAADVQRKWYVVDAEGVVLGRLATQIATILRGKHKPIYTPHVDTGDYVIVVNADKIVLTGKKLDQKIYYSHSGFVGGLKETVYRRLLSEKPEFVIQHAVVGMLPKGPLGRQMAKKLKVFAGPEHDHAAQQPEELVIHQ